MLTADGERTFITNRNGSLWKENIEHVNFDKIKEAKILSLASIFNCPLLDGKTLEKIFKFAKEEGMTITADMIMPRLGETLDDIAGALQYVDYFFPNFDEACLMTGEKEEDKVADKLYSYGIKNVVMKIGKRGCYIRNKDGVMIVPACKGITAIDTIGAGDNFASGFIAALLQGKNLKECGEYANCTAAIAVQHPGATSGAQIPKKWFQPDNMQAAMDMMDKWKPLCEKYNCTVANLALGWILAQGDFLNLLSGSTTVEQIEENVKSAELELEADDVAYMRELAEAIDKE